MIYEVIQLVCLFSGPICKRCLGNRASAVCVCYSQPSSSISKRASSASPPKSPRI